MTKICGIVCAEEDFELGPALRAAYDASWQDGYFRREIWEDTAVGLGHMSVGAVNLDPQPIRLADGDETIVYCGKIFDYGRLKSELIRQGAVFSLADNDAEFLGQFLRLIGPGRLAEINGIFSLVVWSAGERCLTLVADRYGFRPLYYYYDAPRGVFVFASDLRSILATGLPSLRVNWRSVNTFLHFGHLLGEETLFEGIFRLPPAGILKFEKNDVHLDHYWRLADLPVREDMTMDEAVDGCVALFQQAIRRRMNVSRAKHIVLLSGGQDSRHIAAELKRQGVEATAYTTTGFKPTVEDKVLGERAAEAIGIPHVFVPLPSEDFLTCYWPRAHALVDYETDLHEWILPLVDSLPDEPHVNFDGILGDVCLSDLFLNPRDYGLAREGRLDELARQLVEQERSPPIFHPSIARHLDRPTLLDTVEAKFQAFAGHPNLITFMYTTGRTARAISLFAFKLVSQKAESFYPFADNDFFDFAMSIPPEYRLDGRMHRRVLDRAYPELRGVPTTKEVRRSDYYRDEINYNGQKRQYLWAGLRKMLGGRLWAFSRRTALPRLGRDLLLASFNRDSRFFLCNPANVVLAEWFDRYFRDGVE